MALMCRVHWALHDYRSTNSATSLVGVRALGDRQYPQAWGLLLSLGLLRKLEGLDVPKDVIMHVSSQVYYNTNFDTNAKITESRFSMFHFPKYDHHRFISAIPCFLFCRSRSHFRNSG